MNEDSLGPMSPTVLPTGNEMIKSANNTPWFWP